MFGVRGRYFNAAFSSRELLEIIAQTFQNSRCSQYVARAWINQFSVVIVVLHCWSTPFLRIVAVAAG
ncbi:TPA: hypothetical protein N0F65_010337 [Lagenidium giganteum]|uniref:Uncharacterized protein n=1 Tax=Lagenidium giganteum TaxID=4803 RepID=A0AAV2Z5P5_9STRA|nr:TPA: hypothetical protein N0F65_010337 [Lagenidium giganteum]